ncbi:MAG: hypothetical protein U0X71_07890 [Sphingobacteriaceae bacterium]
MIIAKNIFIVWVFIFPYTMLIACKENTNPENLSALTDSTKQKHILLKSEQSKPIVPKLDTVKYDQKLADLANGDTTGRWPVKNQPYPLAEAILPFKRIIAYYGNLYSKKMGILGELPPDEMLAKLDGEVRAWEKVDSLTPVQPALHYIAVVAQGSPGKDGKYRYRMPETQIDSVLHIAKKRDAIVFLDIQVALSDIRSELPLLEKYLKLPQVHLGIDPEFSMKTGLRPGTKIGTYDAADINYCSDYLAKLVRDNHLTPKVFVVHRFTKNMVTNSKSIKLHPEVQLVMNMDGWGEPELKRGSYRHFIYMEPVQFTGFKLFYKNDLKKTPHHMMAPDELMKLKPRPIYVQYQ